MSDALSDYNRSKKVVEAKERMEQCWLRMQECKALSASLKFSAKVEVTPDESRRKGSYVMYITAGDLLPILERNFEDARAFYHTLNQQYKKQQS